ANAWALRGIPDSLARHIDQGERLLDATVVIGPRLRDDVAGLAHGDPACSDSQSLAHGRPTPAASPPAAPSMRDCAASRNRSELFPSSNPTNFSTYCARAAGDRKSVV